MVKVWKDYQQPRSWALPSGTILNGTIAWITSKAAKRLYLLRQLKRADVNAKDLIGFFIARV